MKAMGIPYILVKYLQSIPPYQYIQRHICILLSLQEGPASQMVPHNSDYATSCSNKAISTRHFECAQITMTARPIHH